MKVLEVAKRELMQLRLQSQLNKEVETKLNRLQRESILRDQLKVKQ